MEQDVEFVLVLNKEDQKELLTKCWQELPLENISLEEFMERVSTIKSEKKQHSILKLFSSLFFGQGFYFLHYLWYLRYLF